MINLILNIEVNNLIHLVPWGIKKQIIQVENLE